MFRVRSSNEPLVILDSLTEMQDILQQVERAAVEEARAQGATWSQVAEALNRTRQAVEQRFGWGACLATPRSDSAASEFREAFAIDDCRPPWCVPCRGRV